LRVTRKLPTIAWFCVVSVFTILGSFRGQAQDGLLRIVSPVSGDVVPEGQPLRIVVAADDSVRMVHVMGWDPLPVGRPLGNNVFEMDIAKTISPGKYQLTAVGVTSVPVYSAPVVIQIEREDTPVDLQVSPRYLSLVYAESPYPIFIEAQFADGSKLFVTHSSKITFESKNPAIATVDDQGGVIAHGPGETAIMIGYDGKLFTALLVDGPGTLPGGRVLAKRSDIELGSTSPYAAPNRPTEAGAHNGLAANPGFAIEAVLGAVMPGKQIRIAGTGFTPEQGSGFVTVAGMKAEVVAWSSKEIVVIVPQFTTLKRTSTVSVHQNDVSEDFPVILPLDRVSQH
jgi:hypothetical protein